MLRLPSSANSKMFYFMVIAELLRVKETTAPVLALVMDNIFRHIECMDVGAFSIYVEW